MKQLALILACSVLIGLLVLAVSQPQASALSGAVRVGLPSSSLLVEVDQKKKKNIFGLQKRSDEVFKKPKGGSKPKAAKGKNVDDEPKAQKKSKDKEKKKGKDQEQGQAAKTCGKNVNCDVGYIRLATPNKYGACCELPETNMYACKAEIGGNVYDDFGVQATSIAEARSKFGQSVGVPAADVFCAKR